MRKMGLTNFVIFAGLIILLWIFGIGDIIFNNPIAIVFLIIAFIVWRKR